MNILHSLSNINLSFSNSFSKSDIIRPIMIDIVAGVALISVIFCVIACAIIFFSNFAFDGNISFPISLAVTIEFCICIDCIDDK